jgi:hypothetical protein
MSVPVRKSDRLASGETLMQRFYSWRDRVRDPALTGMLILQTATILVAAPSAAIGFHGWGFELDLLRVLTGLLIVLIARSRLVLIAAVVAFAMIVSGNASSIVAPSSFAVQFGHIGTIIGFIVVSIVISRAVFAPGIVTAHRVLGAIVLYLNFGMVAAAVYRVIWDFSPGAFGGIASDATPMQATGILVYFSFVTLTTIGYGDIFPVNAFARALANLEGIIGQLYPATLLARFVSLEIEARRR